MCVTHLTVCDSNDDVQSGILAVNQFKVFVLHKGTLQVKGTMPLLSLYIKILRGRKK